MARAFGSYPKGHWFKSSYRYHIRPVGQAVKTPPFHGGNTSSNLVRVTNGSLAQLGEHLPYKQRVTGSSPVTSTRNEGIHKRECLFSCLQKEKGTGLEPA